MFGSNATRGGAYRFRVSDAVEVPRRGYLLRLRLLEGDPDPRELRPGRLLRLQEPGGGERLARIQDYAITGGRPTKARLERTRELDVIVSRADALRDGRPIRIGWIVTGTAASADERAA